MGTPGRKVVYGKVSRKLATWFFEQQNVNVNLNDFRKDHGMPRDYNLTSSLNYIIQAYKMNIVSVVPGTVYRYEPQGEVKIPGPPEERERIERAQVRIAAKEQEIVEATKPLHFEVLTDLPDSGDCLLWRSDETIWRATQLK